MKAFCFLLGLNLLGFVAQAQLFVKQNIRGIELLSGNMGVATADYDRDGHLDLYVVSKDSYIEEAPETWSRLFRNNNDATFEEVTSISGLEGSYDYDIVVPDLQFFFTGELRHGASWGDFNNDGYPDLFLTNYKYNKLYQNNQDGTFSDVTEVANLGSPAECYSTSAAWLDYDNDGLLDLLISSWAICPDNRLYRNNGDGTFTDQSEKISIDGNANTWMILPVDVNNDQWIDLLLVNDFRSNALLINDNGVFSDQTDKYNLKTTDNRNHMGSAYTDFNNDGLLDIYISDINKNSLWISDGDKFTERAVELDVDSTDWSWQTKAADIDLDGDNDITVINGYEGFYKNYYLQNDLTDDELTFSDASASSGFNLVSNSMCFELLDYDHDGDLDAFVTDMIREPFFLENQVEKVNPDQNWVKIDLEGRQSNRSAIGTRIELTTNDGKSQIAYYTGVGFMTQSLQPVHFGAGSATEISTLKITWPLGLTEEYQNLATNKHIKLVEGEGYTILEYSSNKIPGCMDVNSCSFNSLATSDDGSCSYLESFEIVGNNTSGILKTESYSYPVREGNSLNWNVENGHILDGESNETVYVKWDIANRGNISVVETGNCQSKRVEKEVILERDLRSDTHSVARLWNEVILEGIRNDYARPTVHARNLFHVSAAMYDVWSLYTQNGKTYFLEGQTELKDFVAAMTDEERSMGLEQAMSHAAYKLMKSRFSQSPDWLQTEWLMNILMNQLGYDPGFFRKDFKSGNHAAVGNYIAQQIIDFGFTDGSREPYGYANEYYQPVNSPLAPQFSGNPICEDPNRWQPLKLSNFIDQSGNLIGASTPAFLSPEWGNVKPFALQNADKTTYVRNGGNYQVYHDPGTPPHLDLMGQTDQSAYYKWNFTLVAVWGSHLDPNDGVMVDISPKALGNIPFDELPRNVADYPNFYKLNEGGDPGKGYSINPITNQPYEPQLVPRGDYARVLAEFWADGPDSETPPGHWFTLLNHVNDHPDSHRKFQGEGEELDLLEWDVKAYFIMGGAMHDAAVSAWGIKGYYDYIRPISAIRYMAERGQSSDSALPNYDPAGIPLTDGYVELVEAGDPLQGVQGENIGKVKLYTWKGHDYIQNTETDEAGVGWILAANWWPYQRPSFVTPPFAGYVSGHSTYSRAAAEVMTQLTGSEYFPGGMGEFVARRNEFLVFEEGPSQDIVLQWATYQDASDQCSLSRIWGGIHPPIDDIPGRIIGYEIGNDAFAYAKSYFNITEPLNNKPIVSVISIYPNPVGKAKRIHITNAGTNEPMRITDLAGHTWLLKAETYHQENKSLEFDLGTFEPGLYLIRIADQSFKIFIE